MPGVSGLSREGFADEGQPMNRPSRQAIVKLRHRLYGILEHGPIGDRLGRIVGRSIVVLIIVNLLAVIVESVPDYAVRYHALLFAVEAVSLVVFTIEFA